MFGEDDEEEMVITTKYSLLCTYVQNLFQEKRDGTGDRQSLYVCAYPERLANRIKSKKVTKDILRTCMLQSAQQRNRLHHVQSARKLKFVSTDRRGVLDMIRHREKKDEIL